MKQILCLLVAMLILPLGSLQAGKNRLTPELMAEKSAPVIENFFASLKAGDFEAMRKDFSEVMKTALTAEDLSNSQSKTKTTYGIFRSAKLERVDYDKDFAIVVYYASYSGGQTLVYQFVFPDSGNDMRIGGLWYKPLPLPDPEKAKLFLPKVRPIAEHFFTSLKQADYKAMTRDFSPKIKKELPPAKLKNTYTGEIFSKYGAFVSAAFERIEFDGNVAILSYRTIHDKGIALECQFIFSENDPDWKIAGLWTRPMK